MIPFSYRQYLYELYTEDWFTVQGTRIYFLYCMTQIQIQSLEKRNGVLFTYITSGDKKNSKTFICMYLSMHKTLYQS